MKRILSAVVCLFALCFAAQMQAAKANKMVTINVNGKSRTYLLYVPNNVQENAPLVLSLHGAGGTVSINTHDPNFHSVADKEGFIVAYPQGLPTTFPGLGGMQANGWTSEGEENFDTDFLKAVVEDVAAKYTIDRQRLYCCGFSNGGMMTYTMANVCSNQFAAFAAISGYPINEFHLHHTSWRPVPFLHIHGKNDDFVKYSLVPNVIDNMVARNGANPVPQKTIKSGNYTKSIYEAGEGGFPIIFYEIDGMGHEPYTANTEKSNSSQTMWDFFKEYTLDSPCDTTLKWRPRIETEGYAPKSHGWTMNSGLTLLKFAGTQKTDANQNVYRSLQFTTGQYRLSFRTEGDAAHEIGVKIQKLTGKKNYVLNTTVQAGDSAVLYFNVTDGWGEYKLTMTRPTGAEIIVTGIAIHSLTAEEALSIDAPKSSALKPSSLSSSTAVYDLQGRRLPDAPVKSGLYIKDGKKVLEK